MEVRAPHATYRLQFNHTFTFKEALGCLDYFAELGVGDCYASPLMRAVPGSSHNYDVTDPTMLNPEIGSEEEFAQFAEGLKKRGMGMMMDIIPNHMCISVPYNKWWNNVLENGPSSPFANYFNIDWTPLREELEDKVLLPFLDDQFGKAIENKELSVHYASGSFSVHYFEARYPTDPCSWVMLLNLVAKELEKGEWGKHEDFYELQSIITALNNLPGITVIDPKKAHERQREKEIIKQRLATLTEKNSAIFSSIEARLKWFNGIKGAPHTFDHLEAFLNKQPYRLCHWRVGSDEINYRRFFDVNELAGIRAENPHLFHSLHEVVLKAIEKRWVTGLRVDHVDGLFSPSHYLLQLQKACQKALQSETETNETPNFYIIAEKILARNETIPPYWPVYGTTGYDFLNVLNGLFVDRKHEEAFISLYSEFTDVVFDSHQLIYQSKLSILKTSMSSELHVLARRLDRISEQHRWSRDFTYQTLMRALRGVMASFFVYRTYISAEEQRIDEEDRNTIIRAIAFAKHMDPSIDVSVFDFIQNLLLIKEPPGLSDADQQERKRFVMRFQQLTGPVMAKGLEDTTFYRAYPLTSLNEVGAEFGEFGITLEDFHAYNKKRQELWPLSLSATSTHDTKRSEDVRARINVLSEIPDKWRDLLHRFEQMNRSKKQIADEDEIIPDRNEEYLLYQTVVGSWPLKPMNEEELLKYRDRILRYMTKALKEAKIHTSWINQNDAYDQNVQTFVREILDRKKSPHFIKELEQFVSEIARPGLYNSLSQKLLKIVSPGVPDLYQGSELWGFILVDPDNRQPIDYAHRKALLKEIKKGMKKDKAAYLHSLMENMEDGRIKLFLVSEALALRKKHSRLFSKGDYISQKAEGTFARNVIAFSRVLDHDCITAVSGRFYTSLASPIGIKGWQDTVITGLNPGLYRDLFTGQTHQCEGSLSVGEVLHQLPFSLLKEER